MEAEVFSGTSLHLYQAEEWVKFKIQRCFILKIDRDWGLAYRVAARRDSEVSEASSASIFSVEKVRGIQQPTGGLYVAT